MTGQSGEIYKQYKVSLWDEFWPFSEKCITWQDLLFVVSLLFLCPPKRLLEKSYGCATVDLESNVKNS